MISYCKPNGNKVNTYKEGRKETRMKNRRMTKKEKRKKRKEREEQTNKTIRRNSAIICLIMLLGGIFLHFLLLLFLFLSLSFKIYLFIVKWKFPHLIPFCVFVLRISLHDCLIAFFMLDIHLFMVV